MKKYKIIKLIILSCGIVALLVILNNFSKNGRYSLQNDKHIYIDTRTGEVFDASGESLKTGI